MLPAWPRAQTRLVRAPRPPQASGSDTANLKTAASAACPAGKMAAFVVATIIADAGRFEGQAGISQHNDDVVLEQDGPPKEVTVKRSSRCQVPHVQNEAVEPFNAHIQPQWSSRPSSASFVQVERLSGVARDRAADASVISDCSERPVLKKGPHETNSLSRIVLVMNVGGRDGPTVHAASISSAAPRSTDTPSSTREEQAIPPWFPDRS